MTLLELVNEAAIDIGLPATTSVMASTDPQIKLLRRCATAEAKSLSSRHNWQALLTEQTFVTLAAAQQTTYAIPTDFDRMIPESMFNRTINRSISGPVDSNMWQSIQSTLVTTVYPAFRFRENFIDITPTPSAGQTVAYEYITRNWGFNTIYLSAWSADTDTYRLNDESMIQGIVWRFKKSKGLSWNDDYLVYERYVGDLIIRDGSRPRIYTDQPNWNLKPVPPWTPDTLVFS